MDPRAALKAHLFLFSEVSVRERFDKMLKSTTMAVSSMGNEEVLACDLEATVVELMRPNLFEFPAIAESGITQRVDPPTPHSQHAPYVLHFFIPFTGEREILKTQRQRRRRTNRNRVPNLKRSGISSPVQ